MISHHLLLPQTIRLSSDPARCEQSLTETWLTDLQMVSLSDESSSLMVESTGK